MTREDAVSEVIGSILLISLVGIAVAIVAIIFLSQPVPVMTQNLNVIAGNNSTHLLLYHDGGDPMVPGEFILQFDTTQYGPGAYTGWLAPGNTWPWEIGETLQIPLNQVGGMPGRILIISTREGQETLIKELRIGQVITPGPITPRPTPKPGPADDCVTTFTERLQNGSVYFTRDRRGNQGSVYGYMNLTINSTGSYIVTEDGTIPLNQGDHLSIYVQPPNRNPEIRIYSVGDIGWSFRMVSPGGANQGEIRINNGSPYTSLIDSWITSFKDFTSTFTISIDDQNTAANTRLIINNSFILNGPSSQKLIIANIKPSEPTLFILMYPGGSGGGTGGNPVFFLGMGDVAFFP